MLGIRGFCAFVVAAIALALPATAKPPLEAFADEAEIRGMDISPDGKRLAYLSRIEGKDYLVLQDIEAKTAKALTVVNDIKARYINFVTDDFILLVTSETRKLANTEGKYEYTGAFSYNLSTNKIVQMVIGTPGVLVAQTGIGTRIHGVDPDGKHVYMPAYVSNESRIRVQNTSATGYSLALLRVDLTTGLGDIAPSLRGNASTRDWIVDSSGKPLMRADMSEDGLKYQVMTWSNGKQKEIYSVKAANEDESLIAVNGITPDGKSLIAVKSSDDGFDQIYRMSISDGSLVGPILQRAGAEVEGVMVDPNRVAYGIAYSGLKPTYDLFDSALQADVQGIQDAYPSSSVQLAGASSDKTRLLFFVSGGPLTERYLLLDRPKHTAAMVGRSRSLIGANEVGEVITIEYKAADGLKIPALITWPAGLPADQRKNLPLVVMPHGGPASYDRIGFDWLAQFLANEGYAVLQPNFRGSAGFGAEFRKAGHGEWGRKMQSDITDGVNAMVQMGWADKARVCIVGWSYGGYAALAGGAVTPDAYKCVASIAGVSNLREMLTFETQRYGSKHRAVRYWKMVIGDPAKDGAAIDAVSPARLVDAYKAPVLLVHGTDDTIVPARQSDMMNDALLRAQKPVEYVKISGDDHGLVDNESRRTMLGKLSEFLAKYLKK